MPNILSTFRDRSNWGIAGTQQFKCRGGNYIYGSAACNSGFYLNVFCESKYSTHGYTCQQDTSPDTIACYDIFKSTHPQ